MNKCWHRFEKTLAHGDLEISKIMNRKVAIKCLSTGVPGLDEILGGGLPEFSFNLVAGPPGSGKTTDRKSVV